MKKVATFLLVIIFACSHVLAQQIEKLNLETLKPSDGLSSGMVTCMLQDKMGFMWFGTVNGLNRYDGYKFTVYRNDPANAASIAENYVTSMLEDSHGRMFVGTANGGVDYFDRVQQRFIHLHNADISGGTRSIIERKLGDVWISQGSNIYRFKEQANGGSLQKIDLRGDRPKNFDKGIRKLTTDTMGNIYVFYNNGAAVLKDEGKNTFALKLLPIRIRPDIEWLDMTYDSFRRRVLVIDPYGITSYKDYNFSDPDTLVREGVRDVCWELDKVGNIWYLGKNGLTRFGLDGRAVTMRSGDSLQQHFFHFKSMLFWDRNGNQWLGSVGYGVAKCSPWTNRFPVALEGRSIHNMYAGYNKDFYVDKDERVVVNADRTATISHLILPEQNQYAVGANRSMWTMYGSHISRFDAVDASHVKYPFDSPMLSANMDGLFNFDDHGKLWGIFNYCPYIASYDTLRHQFSVYKFPPARLRTGYQFAQGMVWDSSGVLWITTEDGLFAFDRKTTLWKHFPIGIKRGIAINPPFITMCNDPAQPARYLWIGTNGNGLWKFDKRDGSYTVIDQRNSIADNTIYGILPDDHGHLRLSSGYGITRFDPITKKAATFDKSDGLQDNEFNWGATAKLTDGTLAFGGLYGINYFKPNEITPLPSPAVTLTGLKLFNEYIVPNTLGSPLQTGISYTTQLQLSYQQNMLTFEFSGLEYYKTRGIHYRYRLAGFDKDWVYAGKENTVTYTNLDIGTYHFFAEASYYGSDWRPGKELLAITIAPPWWKTWWFYLFVVMCSALVIYAISRYRLRQMLRVERLRVSIAKDLHDEIGSTLSTLSIYAKVLQRELPKENETAAQLLENIDQNATQVMNSVSDIVWSINTRYDDFGSIINRMREHASSVFDHRDCTLHYQFDESLINLTLPMDQRKDFYLIYKEALNNIAKYADNTNLWIDLHREHDKIMLHIRDDGKGFEMIAENNGNGIQNMRDRAMSLGGHIEINSSLTKGTDIKLIFPVK